MPFSSLPYKILRDVFIKIAEDYANRWSKIPIAVTLLQVAPFTRRIVHNEARLWTGIDNQVIDNPAYLYLHLDLSRHFPLDISFNPTFYEVYDSSFSLSNFMPLLVHVGRWHRLKLHSDSRQVVNGAIEILKYLRPQMLEELILSWVPEGSDPNSDSDDEEDVDDIRSFFQCGVPCLKKLSLKGGRSIPHATHHLTDLQLDTTVQLALWSYSDFVQIISKMVSLVNISIYEPVAFERGAMGHKTVTLPNLWHLCLEADKAGDTHVPAMLMLFRNMPLTSLKIHH